MTDPTPPRWRTALWRGETAPIPVVRTPTRAVYPRRRPGEHAELAEVDQGASLALRVGTLLLAGGAPTEDVEAAIFAVGTAVGLGVFEVDITYSSIIISVSPDGGRPALTDMRVVRGRSTHFARVAAAHQLVLDLAEGRIAPTEVEHRLSQIEHLRRPYPRWFVIAAFGALSASITVQLGGSFYTALVAFTAASLSGILGNRMTRMRVPTFFVNLVLAFGSALVAVVVTANQNSLESLHIKTPLVIVGGIIALLPGMTLMVAAQEAIGSFAVTAAARLVELTFATIGIVSGVLLGLVLADQLNVTMEVAVRPGNNALQATAAALAACIAAVFAAVTYQSPMRLALTGGALAGIGYFVYLWTSGQIDVADPNAATPGVATAGPAVATGVAALLIGFLSGVLARRLRIPPVQLTAAGIIPLLPGLAVYEGLLSLSRNAVDKGLASLVEATAVAIALAAGVLLGQLVAGRLMQSPLRAFIPQRAQRNDHYR
ncbi:MAG: threonine/serine exporter ThrE family protein [Actinomycetes bacterium]